MAGLVEYVKQLPHQGFEGVPAPWRRLRVQGLPGRVTDENIGDWRIFVEALIVENLVPRFLGILTDNHRFTMLWNTDFDAVKALFNAWGLEEGPG